MFKESFIRAIIASVIFILLQWIGDKYFLDKITNLEPTLEILLNI